MARIGRKRQKTEAAFFRSSAGATTALRLFLNHDFIAQFSDVEHVLGIA